jgi:hypothetical protein
VSIFLILSVASLTLDLLKAILFLVISSSDSDPVFLVSSSKYHISLRDSDSFICAIYSCNLDSNDNILALDSAMFLSCSPCIAISVVL